MKKLTTFLLLGLMALTTLTSCEDENIAYDLEGTWEGRVFDYSEWDGQTYNISNSMIYFELGVFRFKRGNGYWVDNYSRGYYGRNYVSYKIKWEVNNGIIYITFKEDGTTYCISNYRLTEYRFSGTMYEEGHSGKAHDFDLRHIDSPHWDQYYNDYDYYWNGGYYNNYNHYYWGNEGVFDSGDGTSAPAKNEESATQAKSEESVVPPLAPKRHLIVDNPKTTE